MNRRSFIKLLSAVPLIPLGWKLFKKPDYLTDTDSWFIKDRSYTFSGMDMGAGEITAVNTPGKTFWVDMKNGDDHNKGNPDSPLATVEEALNRATYYYEDDPRIT